MRDGRATPVTTSPRRWEGVHAHDRSNFEHSMDSASEESSEEAGDDWYSKFIGRFEVGTEGSDRPILTYGEESIESPDQCTKLKARTQKLL